VQIKGTLKRNWSVKHLLLLLTKPYRKMSATRYNLRKNNRARANSLPTSPKSQENVDSSLSVPPPSAKSTRSAKSPEDSIAPRRYSDIVRGGMLPPREAPNLRHPSSLNPGSRSTSPVLTEREPERLPVVSSNLEKFMGLRAMNSVTQIEVMTAAHTDEGSDGMTNGDESDLPPSPGKEGRDEADGHGWTTVRRKGRKSRSTSREIGQSETLDLELGRAVREAEKRLTPDDRKKINKRIIALKNKPACRLSDRTSETTSRGEGPSTLDKGKGADPHNWGDLSEVDEDFDLDGQRAALESWKLAREVARSSAESSDEGLPDAHQLKRDKHKHNKGKDKASKPKVNFMSKDQARARLREVLEQPVKVRRQSRHERRKDAAEKRNLSPVKVMVDKAVTLSDKRQRRHRTPRAMEPVEQIDPNSYIGLAFKRLDKGKKPTNKK